jgi:DNA-binding MarR family transcriptional regulator
MTGANKNNAHTLRDDSRKAVETCGARQVRIAARRITRYVDARLRGTGLSIEQFNLLTEIAASDDDSFSAIGLAAGLDKSTLSRNLRTLEKQGWVEIAVQGTKSARRHVWLTESGARKLEQVIPVWRAANSALARYVDLALTERVAAESSRLTRR